MMFLGDEEKMKGTPIIPEMIRYGDHLVSVCFPGRLQTGTNTRLMEWVVLRHFANRREITDFGPGSVPMGKEADFVSAIHEAAVGGGGQGGGWSSVLPGAEHGGSLLETETLEAFLWFVQSVSDLHAHFEESVSALGLHARDGGIRHYE